MEIYTGNPCGDLKRIKMLAEKNVGVMLSVGRSARSIKQLVQNKIPVAIDNGAFQFYQRGYPFLSGLFMDLLKQSFINGANPDFIVCPDIVCGGLSSRDFSMEWATTKLIGCPKLALVVQDGIEPQDIRTFELRQFSTIFIGGSVDWKWETAKSWVEYAHYNGKKCHIGRCGTAKKIQLALEYGADSIDSTNFIRNNTWDVIRGL